MLKRPKTACLHVFLCGMVMFLLAKGASGQVNIPSHSLDRSGAGCVVTLVPSASRGDGPRLAVRSRIAGADDIQIGLTGADGLTEVTFVSRNRRTMFQSTPMDRAERIQRMEIWQALADLASNELPFHITGRTASGEWVSTRYGAINPLGIIRILETNNCYSSSVVTSRTTAELLTEERALALSQEDIRHIRWVLAARERGRSAIEPTASPTLTAQDRDRLSRFARSVGEAETRYLNRSLANRLLAMPFEPIRPNLATGMQSFSQDRDWTSYWEPVRGSRDGYCTVASVARTVEGADLWELPVMQIGSRSDWRGDTAYFDLVSPMPFDPNRQVYAIVDGMRYALQIEDGFVKPRSTGRNMVSDDVIRAIRSGQDISIIGTSAQNRRTLTVRFSAYGFTNSFNRMVNLCGRRELLGWIN